MDEDGVPSERPYNVILFAHGYYSSALHEIAHWLVAGEARRKLEDFGYWYEPDGRSAERQREFESAEIKPQAIEWVLATAAGFRYFASADNLWAIPAIIQPLNKQCTTKSSSMQNVATFPNELKPCVKPSVLFTVHLM